LRDSIHKGIRHNWHSQTSSGLPAQWRAISKAVIARDHGICWLCGLPGANSADHVIPRAKNGGHEMANLKAAHMKCNLKKNARIVKPTEPKVSRFG